MVSFQSIEFGYRSAEAERRNMPSLLLEGFFERNSVIEDLRSAVEYIVLGYKGSGKSSIAEHLSLLAAEDPTLFVDILLLRDFPFDQVPEVVGGDADVSVRTNLAWSILLLLKVFESISSDQAATSLNRDIDRIARDLRDANLLPKRNIRDLVLASREVNLSVALSKAFTASVKNAYAEPVLILSQVRDTLRELICNVQTESDHLIVIDGLDEVFTLFENTNLVLASLVHEVDSLNSEFDARNSCAKIILLCRTDLFERLPSPNINKLRDYAINLDWYHNPNRPNSSELFAVATHRARLSGYRGSDVVADFLPKSLRRSVGGDVNTYKFMLEHTRHTPRDFLQLLHYIQAESRSRRLDAEAIFDGMREYSIDYFLPELKDELAGYFTPAQVDSCLHVIGGLRRREFSLQELEEHAFSSTVALDWNLRDALRILFDCSAIGNIVSRPRRRSQTGTYFTFKFRNRNASINFSEKLILHRGVWKALNLS